jgi:hypothetical protein
LNNILYAFQLSNPNTTLKEIKALVSAATGVSVKTIERIVKE